VARGGDKKKKKGSLKALYQLANVKRGHLKKDEKSIRVKTPKSWKEGKRGPGTTTSGGIPVQPGKNVSGEEKGERSQHFLEKAS